MCLVLLLYYFFFRLLIILIFLALFIQQPIVPYWTILFFVACPYLSLPEPVNVPFCIHTYLTEASHIIHVMYIYAVARLCIYAFAFLSIYIYMVIFRSVSFHFVSFICCCFIALSLFLSLSHRFISVHLIFYLNCWLW